MYSDRSRSSSGPTNSASLHGADASDSLQAEAARLVEVSAVVGAFVPLSHSYRSCMLIDCPFQVDLFSRVAFPTFFIMFHIVYWVFYLNV